MVTGVLRAFAGGSLFGTRTGTENPDVLCLPGWGRTHEDFSKALVSSSAIALDLPGFGATPAPPVAWGSEDYAEAIAPVLEEMADQVVVVGHSFGGRVALALAERHPERVRALVLCGVPLLRWTQRARRPPVGYRFVRFLRRVHLTGEARLERARQRHGSLDYRNAKGVMREVLVRVLNENYSEAMGRLRQPVHLVWGSEDTVVPIELAERAVGLFAHGELEVVQGCGHLLPSEAPESLSKVLARTREHLGS